MTAQQRKTLAVIMSLGLIGLVGLLTKRQMGKQKADAVAAVERRKAEVEKLKATIPVVFATRDIAKRTSITEKDVKIEQVPEHNFPKLDYVTSIEEIVGQIALVDLYSQEALLRARVAGKDKVTSLSFLVPKGMRAVSVKINTVDACGGFLNQGDIVDILATFDVSDPSRQGAKTIVSTNLLRNVKILAIDKDYEMGSGKLSAEDEKNKTSQKDKEAAGLLQAKDKVSMVTLVLSPEDAERAVVASETATIKMILPADTLDVENQATALVVTNKDIQDQDNGTVHKTSAPSKSGEPEMVEVDVIRSGKKFQRFMPYEEAKVEASAGSKGIKSDDDWIEPDGWDEGDDLTGVSLPEF